MGVDVNTWVQVLRENEWTRFEENIFLERSGPFSWRDYGLFGFLANIRNYSRVPVITPIEQRSFFYAEFLLSQLLDFDYDAIFEDRRHNGSALPEGEGKIVTFREFLGKPYFDDIDTLKSLGKPDEVKMIMFFDGD